MLCRRGAVRRIVRGAVRFTLRRAGRLLPVMRAAAACFPGLLRFAGGGFLRALLRFFLRCFLRRFLPAAVAGRVPALAGLCAGRLFRAVSVAVTGGVSGGAGGVSCGSRLLCGRGSLALRTGLRARCGRAAAAVTAAGAAAALGSPVLHGGRLCFLRVLVRREGVVGDLLDAPAGEPQDVRVILALGGSTEGHGRAAQPGAARAADAVHIRFGHIRDVIVHDERQLLDVDAAGGDVRGHEGRGTAPA